MRLIWGDLLDQEGMKDTPERVYRFWIEASKGLSLSAEDPLSVSFPCDHDELVLIRDIQFNSICEHHLLPFYGVVDVGYIPQGRVVGLSKVPRCVDILASRPQIQERLTDEIAIAIEKALNPLGVAVVVKAVHTCMAARGVLKSTSSTVTSKMTGIFRDDSSARSEFLELLKQ